MIGIDRRLQQIDAHVTAQIAVGDDAGKLALGVNHGERNRNPWRTFPTIASDIKAPRAIKGTDGPGCMTSRMNFNAAPSLPRG